MDPRIQQLSYSSCLALHSCPRAFQLYKLNSLTREEEEDTNQSLTFLFGHTVGYGVQCLLEGNTYDSVIWKLFLSWDMDIFVDNPKQNKSFWKALYAIELASRICDVGFLSEYDLVYHSGKPACELSFRIHLPNEYKYRGFVDAVLQHKETGEVVVLEIKTTSSRVVSPAQYKNSAQAVGYSVVLDHLFPNLSSYRVIYLPYLTKDMSWEPAPYNKSYLQRALWIQELLLDTQTISLYDSFGVYPMRGESCFNYYRECEYFGLCTMATEKLTSPHNPEKVQEELNKTYDVEVTLEQLIETQLVKSSGEV